MSRALIEAKPRRAKTGGRKAGTPNKATVDKIERAKLAAEIAADVGIPKDKAEAVLRRAALGRRLAKDEVNDTMIPLVRGVIAHLQNEVLLVEPDPDDRTGKTTRPVLKDGRPQIRPGADLVEYRYWTEMLYAMLKDQYPYEAPRFGVFAVGVAPAPTRRRRPTCD
jgi:hypothetical protein